MNGEIKLPRPEQAPIGGVKSLNLLLAGMRPVLHDETYVFVTVPHEAPYPASVHPIMMFTEEEGQTLILPRHEADAAKLKSIYPCKRITLNVHSSLEAVGFLARITGLLASHAISVNPVSAFYHDHLFVPEERAEEALLLLKQFGGQSQSITFLSGNPS